MKQKVTLTIDEDLLPQAKQYARMQGVSLSRLIENTLRELKVDQQDSFTSRWRGKFQAAQDGDARFNALKNKYLR